MSKKQKFWIAIIVIAVFALCVFVLRQSTQKVTYLEYTYIGTNCEDSLDLSDNNFWIEQEFTIPYKLFQGIGLTVGTYGRENNSRYELLVMDQTTNQQIASFTFNTSRAKDNETYQLMLNSPIKIDTTHQFSVIIKAKSRVNHENGVAFYVDKSAENSGNLYYNGNLYEANLCMNIYGGDSNAFWFVFALVCEVYVVALLIYILCLYTKQKSIKSNVLVQVGLLGIAIFALLAVFARMESFSDEVDNIIGGMLIGKGKILYVDYYTQHTPFAYLLCAIFSIFGAGSVEQFRLIYYVMITFAYIALYLRHKENFGKAKMALLPVLQIMFGMLIAKESVMILSDNIQAICMTAFLLEFLQYLKDEKLDWMRVSIVSICIFGAFCSAFVSIYAIFAIGLGVFFKEILYWKRRKLIDFKSAFARYWKLVIACAVPFVLLFCYFVATHSLIDFYKQAFVFNRQVYSYYLDDGFGTNVIQPFFIGIRNFIQIIPNAIQNIIECKEVIASIVNIILAANLIIFLVDKLKRKQYLEGIILFLFISFGFTRTNEPFHAIVTWTSILTIVVTNVDFYKMSISKIVFVVAILFIVGNYMNHCTMYLFKKEEPITSLDQKIISQTSETEEIFFDIYSNSSVYLIYKNREPINRLGFILPWYMDWYELDTIEDLINKHPRLVVYDEDLKAWEISGYDDYLRKYLHENYERTPQNNKIWILK